MSYKPYQIAASKNKSENPESTAPQVNRFSDIREVDARRHEVLDYMMMGYQPEEISEYLSTDVDTINNDIEAIIEKGYEARQEDIEEIRDDIIRIYRLAIKESYRAFKLSQGEVETKTIKYGEGGDRGNGEKNIDEETIKTVYQSGDSKHIRNVIDAAKEMGKVSGAQKHKEVEVSNSVNNNTLNILSPDRTKLPNEFDRWTKKPDGENLPDKNEINMEDI